MANLLVLFLPLAAQGTRVVSRETLVRTLDKVDVMGHFQGSFQTGALDTAHLVFFLVWILALLFLAVRVVEARRWLG